MVDLMGTGAYDGVSASGDATLRLIAREDVAPVDYGADAELCRRVRRPEEQVVQHRRRRRLRRSARPRAEPVRVPQRRPAQGQQQLGGDLGRHSPAGKLSIYDNPIFIADAAVYLKATQPDLGIENPYALDEKQFDAAVDLLKEQRPEIAKYWTAPTYATR